MTKTLRDAKLPGLRRKEAATKMGDQSPSRSRQVAARPQSNADLTTYTGRLGAAVRKHREALGISVEAFTDSIAAQGVDVTASTVYHWEKGLRPIPVNAIPAMAKTLKLAVRELVPAK